MDFDPSRLDIQQLEALMGYLRRLKMVDPKDQGAVGMQSVLVREHRFPSGIVLHVRKGDLTKEPVKVIVNAANNHLHHGAGLAGAIVRAGGQIIQIESKQIALEHKLKEGDVVETTSGRLQSTIGIERVFHAVGPHFPLLNTQASSLEIMSLPEDHELYTCAHHSLQMAHERGYDSISLPAISSGIFGFPKDRCAKILFRAVEDFESEYGQDTPLKYISFTNFDDSTVEIFAQEFDERDYQIIEPETTQIEEEDSKPEKFEESGELENIESEEISENKDHIQDPVNSEDQD